MASASKSQSTRRSSEAPNKIKIQMNGGSAKVVHEEDSDGSSSDSSSPESSKVTQKTKEPTKDDQTKKKKEAPIRVDYSVLENVTCTACGRQLNPYKNNSVQKHNELKVIICKKCDKFLSSGKIAKDKDGIDEQCRWCGEGGRLVVCDHCSCAFCKACVMRNFNRSEFNNINSQESWKCYLCDKSQLQGLKDNYRNVRDAMKALQAKKKKKEEAIAAKETAAANGRNPPGRSPQNRNRTGLQGTKCVGSDVGSSSSDGGVALSVKDLEVDYTKVEVIMDKLSTATSTFKEMLRALRSQFHSTSPRAADEAPPMFSFSLGNSVNIEAKKQRCAKALNMGLHTYFQSLCKILHPQDSLVSNSSAQTQKSAGVSNSSSRVVSRNVRTNKTVSIEEDVTVLDSDSSEEDEAAPIARTPRGKLSNKTGINEKDTSSKTSDKNGNESLKGKLSVSSLFSKPSKSSDEGIDGNSSFKTCSVLASKKSKGESSSKDIVESDESAHLSDTGDANEDNGSCGNDKSASVKNISNVDVVEETEDTAMDAADENNAAKMSMLQQLTEEISDSNSGDDDEDNEEDNEDSSEEIQNDEKSATKGNGTSSNCDEKRKGISPNDSAKSKAKGKGSDKRTLVDEGENSKSPSPIKKAKLKANEQVQINSTDIDAESECVTSSKDTKSLAAENDSVESASTDISVKDKSISQSKETKSQANEKDSDDNSKPLPEKAASKSSVVQKEKLKSLGDSKGEKCENSDNDDDGSSSDPLDSDEDSGDDGRKTKKRKATGKETVKAKDKTADKAKETDKPAAKEAKNTQAQSGANNAKKSNGLPAQTKAKTDSKKNGKAKAINGDDEEDEVDKEIEKLSKLPTVQKKKTKKDQKEEEPETPDPKKGTRQSTRVAKKKVVEDLDGLSSDDGDEEKSESEEDVESDMEPAVSFGVENEEDVAASKDNSLAKNQLLEEEDEEEAEDDDEDDEEGDDSSDNDVPSKKSKSKKGKLKKGKEGDEEDDDDKEESNDVKKEVDNSDSDDNIGGRKRRMRSKLLDSKLTDSDSDVGSSKKKKPKEEDGDASVNEEEEDESSAGSSLDSDSDEKDDSSEDDDDEDEDGKKKKKKGKKRRRKRKNKKDGSNEEEDEEEGGKGKKGKKRKRIKKMSDSSDEGDDDDDKGGFGKRKKIRKVMSNKKLEDTTKAAAKAEEKRRKRIAAKQREFNIETVTDENNPMNAPMTTKLILEPGKEEGDDPVIQVNKKLIRKLKPHQVEAVQFMWDCLYESVKRSKKEEGAGCILAHCMGLGKTLSVISFVHTVLTHHKYLNQRTCLVVCPLNTVLNWRNEWTMWFDKKDQLEVWELASCKQNVARAELLREWQESGGIMIIGYEMYRNLTMGARIKNKKQKKAFQETLVDPGPDLCVCDEGHILKNENSSLSKSMNMMKTRRRIVLTGTPLQNNLNEYHCMVNFVKPNLLGTRKEFNNRFISPIQNGQCTDSTQRDVRIMKARAHVLHEMLAGCVQRRDYSALTKFLPPKQEYVMSIRLSEVQIELYQKYLEVTGQGVDGVFNNKGARLFKDYQNLMKIWTHPWVLKLAEIRDELKMKFDDDEDSFIDDDSDEERSDSSSSSDDEENIISDSGDDEASSVKGANSKKGTKRTRANARRQAGEDSDPEEVIAEWKSKMRGEKGGESPKVEPTDNRVTTQWWADYVTEEDERKLELSNKLYLLFEILRMCEEIGDKVLIFSQSILSLNIIEGFLETVDNKFQEEMDKKIGENENENPEEEKEEFGKSWTKNLDYYRMDGSTSAHHRQMWAESFNDMDNYRARLFLISTKAGGLGINLVAANRVIIFDASWNPSHDVQSIFRVYRFGQTKPCYIYRFLAQGTMEEKIYERQVTKLSLSQRVVDEHQIERHFSANDLRELYNFKPEKWEEEGEHATLALPKDPLLAEILKTHRKCVVSFHEHDSLLENQIEQTLSEEEKKAAWEEYENEKKGIIVRGPGMESMRGASWPMMAAAQILSKEQIAATVHALRQQLPDLPEDVFHMHVQQALRRQVQMKQDEMRRMEMMRMQELTYLNMMQQQQQEMGGMSSLGAMQNMAPWMQIQQLRAMHNHHMMRGNRNYMMGSGMSSGQISNRPEEAINLDESPSKS